MDLHIHTPASIDYQQPDISPLQILQAADARGLDIIAFTDHNSVRGYADLWREIEDLELLEFLDRMKPEERDRLAEYRRLLNRMLVLPGFEFTATFGFHILAIFPESTSVRLMEHLLLQLGVAEDRFGSGEVGATTDVLRAYEILADHGALVIGAHVNSTHGIAMQGLRFGGQTKIAYTQDPNLHALEVTDLSLGGGRRSTARFFNGTKAEYPRRMHSIQGSDAHRLDRDPNRDTNLGIGDRITEVELPEVSFKALKELFESEHWDRVRAFVGLSEAVQSFREDRTRGNTTDQAFHESLSTKKTGVSHILRDVVAFANGDGGTIYVGASAFEKRPVVGVNDPEAAMDELKSELATATTPIPEMEMDTVDADGKTILTIRVGAGTEKPYTLAPGHIYVREGAESVIATRDQIVAMVQAASSAATPAPRQDSPQPSAPARAEQAAPPRDRDDRQSRDTIRGQRGGERGPSYRDDATPRDDMGQRTQPQGRSRPEPSRYGDRAAGRPARPRAESTWGEPAPYDDPGDGRRYVSAPSRPPRDEPRQRYEAAPRQAREWSPDDDLGYEPYRDNGYSAGRGDRRAAPRGGAREGDDRGGNRRYDTREPIPFARMPVGVAPDGGPERHLPAPPDRIAPGSGVEIVAVTDVNGVPYYTVHDLRHEEYIQNVTADTGKRLWRYAIEQYDDLDANLAGTRWDGDFGFVKSYRPRGGERRYNVAWRGNGDVRIFYGVSEDDLGEPWRSMIPARGR